MDPHERSKIPLEEERCERTASLPSTFSRRHRPQLLFRKLPILNSVNTFASWQFNWVINSSQRIYVIRKGKYSYLWCSSILSWMMLDMVVNERSVIARATGSLLSKRMETRLTSSALLITLINSCCDSLKTEKIHHLKKLGVPSLRNTSASLRRAVLITIGKGNSSIREENWTMAPVWAEILEVFLKPLSRFASA